MKFTNLIFPDSIAEYNPSFEILFPIIKSKNN